MEDLARFCCQNTECPDYGKRHAGNLTVCDRYGPNQERRMLASPRVRHAFPNAKERRSSERGCRRRTSSRSWPISTKAVACARPAGW